MPKPNRAENITVRKSLLLKAADTSIDANNIKGAAAMMGNLDRGNDVIFPGVNCFGDCLPAFLASGFVAVGHAWDELPVAYPTKAEERGRELYTEATFHSTSDAQDARTVALERKAAGLSVGLSIGFKTSKAGYNWFDTGDELLTFAQDTLSLNMSLFDVEAITKHNDYCRGIWKIAELYEYSIVPVPMNAAALMADIKAAANISTKRDFENFLRDAGFSRSQSVAITAAGFKQATQRDSDADDDDDATQEILASCINAALIDAAMLDARILGVAL